MALLRSKEVPKDAVILDELAAVEYAWNLVQKWEPSSETWALRYSVGVLGGLSSITGFVINRHFRSKLKLGTYGQLSSLIPVTLLPGIFTALFHRHLVTTDMLLMKTDKCPLCYELRSAAIQWSFGIGYPMLMAPLTALMLANRYNTARVPSLVSHTKDLFNYTIKMSKPLSGTLVFFVAIQLLASSVLTHYEMKNHLTIRKKISVVVEKYERENSS